MSSNRRDTAPAQRGEFTPWPFHRSPLRSAAVKNRLKYSSGSLAEVIEDGKVDPVIGKMKVTELLESMPGVGRVRARAIMAEVGIAESRRVRGLGANQIAALLHKFERP